MFLRRIKVFLFNGILLTLAGFGMRSVDLFFNVYISNKIGTEAVGVYQLILSVYLFFITMANSGINLATTRIVSEQEAYGTIGGIEKAMKKCIVYSLFFGSLACSCLFFFAPFATEKFLHGRISELCLQVLACSLPFIAVASCINGYFSGIRKVKKTVYYQVFEEFVKIFLVVVLLNFVFPPSNLEQSCISLVLGATVSELLSFLFLLFLLLKDKFFLSHRSFNDANYNKQILKIALPISFTSYIRSGLSSLKHVLIPLQLEKSGLDCSIALSQYGIINGMVFPLIMFPCSLVYSFSSLLIPEFSYMNAKNESAKMNYALNRVLKFCFLFSFLVMGFLWCFARELSNFIYPGNDVAFFVRVLCPLVVLMYIDNVVDSILKGLDKQVAVMGINIVDLVTTIGFIYFLLPYKGVNGYIFALFVSEILNGVLSLLLLVKETGFKIDFADFLVKPLFCVIFLNFIFSYFDRVDTWAEFIFYGTIFIVLYFILLILFRAIVRKDMKF